MNKISDFFKTIASNLKTTIVRFPIVLILLSFISVIVSILIENIMPSKEQLLIRMIFASIIGVLLSTAAQFLLERFEQLSKYKLLFRISSIILAILYFFLLTTDDNHSQAMFVRLFVCSFAIFAIYLFIPSSKGAANFGKVALVHFKSAFTSILYGVVLYLGLLAIYFAIDLLLFNIDNKVIGHIANIVFIFFTPMYYLSLLPSFNSEADSDKKRTDEASVYPRVLDILVTYIVIPLITVFSAVLSIYFIKILVTGIWPVGQVGPMVLGYSATGLFIYILGSNLDNRFNVLFRKLLPFVLIPLVAMQLASSYIRISAYGITESRYYVVLFGVFSICCAVYLIFSKKKNSNMIVLLAACFAVFSIIPPVDAFNVSKQSQTNRIEKILVKNNMLTDSKIVPNSNISKEDKFEITSITYYMSRMGYLKSLKWIPESYYKDDEGFYSYENFKKLYGFEPNYDKYLPGEEPKYAYASLDADSPIDINGYDTLFKINFYSNTNTKEQHIKDFNIDNKKYIITQSSKDNGELVLSIMDENKKTVMEISMTELFDKISEKATNSKFVMSPEELTVKSKNDTLNIKIIIENISIEKPSSNKIWVNGSANVFVAAP